MAKEIPLTKGQIAIVDDEDYEKLIEHKWCAQRARTKGTLYYYAVRMARDEHKCRYTEFMHHVIMGRVKVDHKNHNGLDNRRENLRIANQAQNNANRRKDSGDCSSKYKGVTRENNRWRARIKADEKRIHLGLFHSEEEAARAYDQAAKELFGEFALLNFPEA